MCQYFFVYPCFCIRGFSPENYFYLTFFFEKSKNYKNKSNKWILEIFKPSSHIFALDRGETLNTYIIAEAGPNNPYDIIWVSFYKRKFDFSVSFDRAIFLFSNFNRFVCFDCCRNVIVNDICDFCILHPQNAINPIRWYIFMLDIIAAILGRFVFLKGFIPFWILSSCLQLFEGSPFFQTQPFAFMLHVPVTVPWFDTAYLSRIHNWTRQDELNECLVCAPWTASSSFTETSNEVALKWMENTFSLKYRLETDSVRYAASVFLENSWTRFALLPWHIHIHILADACLASFATSFKCGYNFELAFWRKGPFRLHFSCAYPCLLHTIEL